jgi:hypothetical protein
VRTLSCSGRRDDARQTGDRGPGTADPERGDRGATVAVERGTQDEAGLDQFVRVAKGRGLIRSIGSELSSMW